METNVIVLWKLLNFGPWKPKIDVGNPGSASENPKP